MSNLPPGLLLLLAPLLGLVRQPLVRRVGFVLLPLLSLVHLACFVPEGTIVNATWMGIDLVPVRADRIALIWGWVFHVAAILSAIYGLHRNDVLQPTMGLGYAGSAIAAVFAGDLLSLFLFWELTAITSVFLVWGGQTPQSYRAGLRYLLVQVGSGVLLLAGTLVLYSETGQLRFGGLGETGVLLADVGRWSGALILVAFGIKAAFPLLHTWLADAYPEASPTGTVFLSAFTTKLAIYALLRGFAGWEPLIAVGSVMALVPLVYAVAENDMRRCLAYCLNNQLGFMVVAVGVGSELAINGAAAHAVAHILYKGLLFMAAGAVLYRVGTARISRLGGLAGAMPVTFLCYLVGVAAISMPLFSGFVTKSMSLSAVAEVHHETAWICLLVATAGVFWVCGPRLIYQVFLAPSDASTSTPQDAPWNMKVAMAITAALCLLIGLFPIVLYRWLPYDLGYRPYTVPHVVGQLQLMAFASLTFLVCVSQGWLPNRVGWRMLDVDWFVRGPFQRLIGTVAIGLAHLKRLTEHAVHRVGLRVYQKLSDRMADDGGHTPFKETGQMAMWAAVMLILYLLVYYG